MSYLLHLETATKVCSVALSFNGNSLQLAEFSDDQYSHGEKLTLLIQEVLEKQKITPKDLSAVCVSSGPGSYTGLRIGVSTAKGLCYALSIPLIAVNTLESFAQEFISENGEQNLCALIDARRMEVFSAIYSSDGKLLKATSPDILDENSYAEFEPLLCFGDGAEKTKELWMNRPISYEDSFQASAKTQVNLAFQKFSQKDFVDVAYFEPNYVKAFHDTRK
jgi:tRNA threonylcarbamoyladenosine biosynthesis protein TsaB